MSEILPCGRKFLRITVLGSGIGLSLCLCLCRPGPSIVALESFGFESCSFCALDSMHLRPSFLKFVCS
jgi:hypothetical protein